MQREVQYKDKKVPRTYCSNRPKTRMVLFLLTVSLLITYSVYSIGSNTPPGDTNRVSDALRTQSSAKASQLSHKDGDTEYSKNLLGYSRLKGYLETGKTSKGNNGMDAESIDTTLDSRVVGSITMDRKEKERVAAETALILKADTVRADVTRAYREEAKTYERKPLRKTLDSDINTMSQTASTDESARGHVGSHLQDGPSSDRPRGNYKQKAVVEQIDNGGLRILDRIDMSS